ncbi:hypothetical protein COX08_00880 [Candidatus Beckwithbacteria bacterium CG23_combo_of_CG06-09_8_20_14_all_34_8]|uniref:Uncharacterized protein n=1 Tax=Candidatus Beckwithbacteria bacterium CG23_combo_of_CG06-09_8_20_14_all_34_8 TaxID=1974497 RepID=A0A2H0B753_9BACT|nr:MAG: hypothetical protein COX08_00880 [Candidatus Beckwithbacteria bacterium CG23_combo_of_CG06-09_8_20_14_all_34_8]
MTKEIILTLNKAKQVEQQIKDQEKEVIFTDFLAKLRAYREKPLAIADSEKEIIIAETLAIHRLEENGQEDTNEEIIQRTNNFINLHLGNPDAKAFHNDLEELIQSYQIAMDINGCIAWLEYHFSLPKTKKDTC